MLGGGLISRGLRAPEEALPRPAPGRPKNGGRNGQKPGDGLSPDESDVLPPARRPLRRFLGFVWPHYRLMLAAVALATLRTGILLLFPLLVRHVIDDVLPAAAQNPAQAIATLQALVWPMIALMVVMLAAYYARIIISGVLSLRIIIDLRTALLAHVQRLGLRFFEQRKTGVVISRLLDDVNLAQSFVSTALSTVAVDALSVVIALGLLLYLDWQMTLIALVVLPLTGVQMRLFRERLRQTSRVSQEQHARMSGNLHEKIAGHALVIAHHAAAREDLAAFRLLRSYFRARLAMLRQSAAFHTLLALFTQCAPLMLFWYAAWRMIHDPVAGVANPLTLGDLVAFMAYLGLLLGPVSRFAELNLSLNQSLAGVERVFQLMDVAPDVVDRPGAAPLARPVRGLISLHDVHFHYVEGHPVIRGITLDIPAGTTLALVGTSGHGKSTLIKLMARLYDVRSGRISLDGRDVRDIPLGDLRSVVGMVAQETVIFSGSVRDNIAYGALGATHRVPEQALIEAAQAAHAWEFIERLPLGLDTTLGERGVKLSAGQRQRIALARLFLRNPPVLLLDEATSALDTVSERLVQDALEHLMSGRTCVVIAHRLSTILHAHRIAVIHEGRVAEMGTHAELLASNGLYTRLHQQTARSAQGEPAPEE